MMKKTIFKGFAIALLGAVTFASCKKDDDATPVEPELITTMKLTLTNKANAGEVRTYTYKVENGFNNGTQGTVVADTLRLTANASYATTIQVLNEKAYPVQDITTEILEEQTAHLFLFNPTPTTGAGSVAFSNGNSDTDGKPFNLAGTLTAGAAGSGRLNLYLIHEPANKNALTLSDAGGETDAAAMYPVRIQ